MIRKGNVLENKDFLIILNVRSKLSWQYSPMTADNQAQYSQQEQRKISGTQEIWELLSSWSLPGLVSSPPDDMRHSHRPWRPSPCRPLRWSQPNSYSRTSIQQTADTKSSFRLCCNLRYSLSYSLNRSKQVNTAAGFTYSLTAFDVHIQRHS